jgi:hypothetical protein
LSFFTILMYFDVGTAGKIFEKYLVDDILYFLKHCNMLDSLRR